LASVGVFKKLKLSMFSVLGSIFEDFQPLMKFSIGKILKGSFLVQYRVAQIKIHDSLTFSAERVPEKPETLETN
jgi:hypothetical protein